MTSGRDFRTIGVVGLGTMGAGIAEVFARNGYDVVGIELAEDSLKRGRQHVEHSTGRAVRRGKLSEEDQAALIDRIRFSTTLEDVKSCDLVVEAVVERLLVKQELLRRLDDIVAPDAVLATNTSSLSVTEIATATGRPGRVVGLHFFNPAPVQKLVEIIGTVVTEPDLLDDVAALARSLDKIPVVCGDKAGFIANALLFGYLNHAVSMFAGKYVSREDIDAAMRVGCGYPMGPLALLDLIGLDTAYEILDTMYKQGRDRLHAPAPVLRQMVTAGLVGRKAGRGFYTYEASDSPVVVADALTPSADDEPKLRHNIRTVGVVGNGTMATGIVEVFVKAGFDVTHVADSTSLDDLGTVDIVVEAVSEDLALKTALFENLDGVCKPGAILATTTSSLPVISLAKATSRPQDVIGVHFFEPVPVKELVEIVSTVSTSSEVAETARALGDRIGKVVVSCGDSAGSVVNALLFPYLNDAVRMLEAHYATADDIDTAMKHGCALPTGPFELLDMVGNDVALAIQRRLYLEFREPGFAPAPLLGHLVMAGHIGRETGRGFRDHSGR